MRIKRVKSQEHKGCAVACLSMVTGIPYWTISKAFERDFNRHGMPFDSLKRYAGDAGFAIIEKIYTYWNVLDQCKEEMWKPFAPVHIVITQPYADSEDDHAVVMLGNGNIICPNETSEAETKQSYQIRAVLGLYK